VYQSLTFTAAPRAATLIYPVDGAVDVDTSQPFSWSSVPGAQGYYLMVGTTANGNDLVNSGVLPTSQVALGMPVLPTGRTLYATFYVAFNGAWTVNQTMTFSAAPGQASFSYPVNGQINVDITRGFSWTTVACAQGYYLTVGTTQYGSDLVNSGVLPVGQSSLAMPGLPSGQTLYATLYTATNGTWARYQTITFTR
jgi:hypothetical protein